jgi:transcriptional regulator with XRE-family HTH domain
MSFTPPSETVGERVRRQRKALKLEQKDLADRSGVGIATVARIEAGASPREDTLAKLAKALGAPVGWLRTGER